MSSEKRDIVERLNAAILHPGSEFPPNGWAPVIEHLLRDCLAEIEHLRSLAGAVSQGESFDDIAKRVGRQSKDAPT